MENQSDLVTGKQVESVSKTSPKEKNRTDGFYVEFSQPFMEELTLILCKPLHRIEEKGTLPKYFYETIITL